MQFLIEHFQREWGVISQAPWTFAVAFCLIWGAVHAIYRYRLAVIKEEAHAAKSALATYKEITKSETPEEARERIDALEDRLAKTEDELAWLPV